MSNLPSVGTYDQARLTLVPGSYPRTDHINGNERAWGLYEGPLRTSNKRIQIITVERNDTLYEYWTPMAQPIEDDDHDFQIPAYFEHTVDELRDMADALRDDTYPQERMKQIADESTLVDDWRTQTEQAHAARRRISQFGPLSKVQR